MAFDFTIVGTCRKYVRQAKGHTPRWAWWITNDTPKAKCIAYGMVGSEQEANEAADAAIKRHGLDK